MNPITSDSTTQSVSPQVTITEEAPGVFVRRSPTSKYVVEYHREACTGVGTCDMAKNTFKLTTVNGELKAEMIVTDVIDDDEIILAAAQSCPVFAIFVFDAETGEQVFPPPTF